jgi:hypothetical protein
VIGVIILQLAFLSCVNDSGKTTKQVDLSNEEGILAEEEIFYRFPSPEEVFKFIQTSDLEYNNGSLNNVADYKNYIGLKKQALNLGVYISDLAYITMFEQHEESLAYYMAIHKLSEELNISAAYDLPLVNRIEENFGNSDSLVAIASDAYNNIVNYLLEHEQEDILAYISAGALIESLYLTLEYVDLYEEDSELIKKILSQKYMIANLTAYVNLRQNDKEINNELQNLNEIFKAIGTTESKTTVEKTETNKLIIGGGEELSITEENIVKLKSTLLKLRNNFIKL